MSPRTKGNTCWHQAHGQCAIHSVGEFFLSRVKCNDSCPLFLPEGLDAILFRTDGRSGNDKGRDKREEEL